MPLKERRHGSSKNSRREARARKHRSVKFLREERLDAYKAMERMRRRLDEREDGKFSKEQKQEWDNAVHAFNNFSRKLKMATQARDARRQIDAVEEDSFTRDHNGFRMKDGERKERDKAKITDETRNLAIGSWFKTRANKNAELSREEREACQLTGLNPNVSELEIKLHRTHEIKHLQSRYRRMHPAIAGDHMRTISINSPDNGGVLTSPSMVQNLEVAMMDYSGILQVAEIISTDHGNDMIWPTANDTGNKGRRIGAGKATKKAVTNIFAKQTWKAYKYTSDEIEVENEMYEDSGFDFIGALPQICGERIGRIFNDEGTTGDGGSMPKGITNAPVGFTSATSGVLVPDDIIRFLGKVDPAYRQGGQIMMNDAIMTEVAVMKDGQNNYIWKAGLELGMPDRIRQYAVVPNVSMASTIAVGNLVMAFGQLNYIKVRRIRGMRFTRFPSPSTDTDKFYAFVRMDSQILDAGGNPIKLLKVHT